MKAQIEMSVVIDCLILLRHLKAGAEMWEFAKGDPMLPQGFKMIDVNRTLEDLEAVKVTASELLPQLRVK